MTNDGQRMADDGGTETAQFIMFSGAILSTDNG